MTEHEPLTAEEFEALLNAFERINLGRMQNRTTWNYTLHYALRTIDIEVLPRPSQPDRPTPAQVLAAPMLPNDADAPTVRAYLLALLAMLWAEREGFGGKRPFGESGWPYHLYAALGQAGFIRYELGEHGYPTDVDKALGDELIHEAIQSLVSRG